MKRGLSLRPRYPQHRRRDIEYKHNHSSLLERLQHQKYFGYDLVMEPLSGGQYRFTFSPLSLTPQKMEEIFDSVKAGRFCRCRGLQPRRC